MNEQDLMAANSGSSLLLMLLPVLINSLAAFLVVHFDKTQDTIKRFPFLAIAIASVIVHIIIAAASIYMFGDTAIMNVISAILGAAISAALTWFIVKRVRDAGLEKAISYFSCIPLVGTCITIYLFFAKSKPQIDEQHYPAE